MAGCCVLIPAFNEADLVGDTVRAATAMPGVDRVLVIDDGSTDGTAATARDAGAEILSMPRNSGKGAALNAGLSTAGADVILMIDADLGSSAGETHRLLAPVLDGEADMSIAVMQAPSGHRGGFGFVMRLSRWAVRRYGGREVRAPLSGQRALRKKLVEEAGGFAEGFGLETALTIDALRLGYRVVEVPLPLTHRLSGRNLRGFIHRGRQFVDILRAVWRRRR